MKTDFARRGFSAALLLATCFGAAACGTSNPSPELSRPKLTSIPLATASLVLPFDQFELPNVEIAQIQRDEITVLQRCMQKRGVVVEMAGDYVRPPEPTPVLWGGRLGTMSLEHATQYGYHAGGDQSFALGPGFYLRSLTNISPLSGSVDAQGNFFGRDAVKDAPGGSSSEVPKEGCLMQVEKQIDVPIVDSANLYADLSNRSLDDSRVRKAVQAWVSCMATAGYKFSAVDEPSTQFTLASVGQKERDTAVSDVKCTASSNWASIYYAVLGAYEKQAVEKNHALLAKQLEQQKKRQSRLQTLVSSGN